MTERTVPIPGPNPPTRSAGNSSPKQNPAPAGRLRAALGLPVVAIIGLALLGAVRVVLHDLDLIHEGTAVNALFVFVPPVVWIAVVVLRRVPNPFLTVFVIGCVYGVLLMTGHQVLWEQSFAGNPPRLGGTLSDLDPSVQSLIIRVFAGASSLATGAVVGTVTGLVAWPASRLATGLMRRGDPHVTS